MEGKVEKDSSSGATASGKMSYEKLLSLAKALKVKVKRLEAENSGLGEKAKQLEQERLNAAAATAAASNEDSGSGSKDIVLSAGKDKDKEVAMPSSSSKDSSNNSMLFWELIQRDNQFNQRLAKQALISLTMTLCGSNLGRSKLLLRSNISTSCAFHRWKDFCNMNQKQELERQVEENNSSYRELEIKSAKLKALLSRTHQANKQQLEDANAIKKVQETTSQELKNHAEEKVILLEQMRAREVESAFQQDLEIYIQRAADEVFQQHQRINESKQANADLRSQEFSVSLSENLELCEKERDDLSKTCLSQDEKIIELSAQVENMDEELKKEKQCHQLSCEQLTMMKLKIQKIESELTDQKCQKREIELELDVTLKSRGDILSKIDLTWEEKRKKQNTESFESIENLRKQCEQAESKVIAAQNALDNALKDNMKLKNANNALQKNSNEVGHLRKQIIELRRSIRRPNNTNLSPKKDSNEVLINKSLLNELCSNGLELSKVCKMYSTLIFSEENETAASQNNLNDFVHKILDLVHKNVVTSVPKSISSSSSPDFLKIRSKLEKKIQDLEDSISKEITSEAIKPLIWETTKVEIKSGANICLVIPRLCDDESNNEILEWSLKGANGVDLTLQIDSENGSNDSEILQCPSLDTTIAADKGDYGRIQLGTGERNNRTRTLILMNPSWSTMTIAYKIRLFIENKNESNSNRFEIENKLEDSRNRLDRFIRGCEISFELTELRERILKAEMESKKQGKYNLYEKRIGEEETLKRFQELCEETKSKHNFQIKENMPSSNHSNHSRSPSKSDDNGVIEDNKLSSDDLKIKSADDFRLSIPFDVYRRPFRLYYNIELPGKEQKSMDLGVAILKKMQDGTLPQLLTHRKIKEELSGEILIEDSDDECLGLIVLFDNSHSWMRPKNVRYSILLSQITNNEQIQPNSDPVIQEEESNVSFISPNKRQLVHNTESQAILELLASSSAFNKVHG